MGKMTCARIAACKTASSERHNQREKDLDYVRKDLSKNNRQEVGESIAHRLDRINKIYESAVGQRMQKTAEPILECVLVVDQNTTLDQVKEFGRLCQKEFGLTPFQFYLHKDEGHYDQDGQWLPNYHAHIVFDATQQDHRLVERTVKINGKNLKGEGGKPLKKLVDGFGKTIKLNRQQLAKMQDLAAQATGLVRGKPSTKQGLSAIEFKIDQKQKALKDLDQRAEQSAKLSALQNILAGISIWKGQREAAAELRKITAACDSKGAELMNITDEVKLAQTRIKGLTTMISNLESRRAELSGEIERLEEAAAEVAATSVEVEARLQQLRLELSKVEFNLEVKRSKLAVAEQQLSDIRNRADFYTSKSAAAKTAIAGLRDELHSLSDIATARAVGFQQVAHVVSDVIEMLESNGVKIHDDNLLKAVAASGEKSPEDIRNSIDLFGALMIENYGLANLILGGVTSTAGGGGVTSDLPWRNPDEDDEQWRQRAAAYAFSVSTPTRRRKMRESI